MVYLSPLSLILVEPFLSSQKLLPWHAYNQRETRDYDKVPHGECHKGGKQEINSPGPMRAQHGLAHCMNEKLNYFSGLRKV